MKVKEFFDLQTYTLTYLVFDQHTKDTIVIDPVLNYNPNSGQISTTSFENVNSFIKENNLKLHAVLETHAHADHITGAKLFKKDYPNLQIIIGENITVIQDVFKKIFNLKDFKSDGSQFDKLISDNDDISFGSLNIKVMSTPGHTPACLSYYINDKAVFTGDALLMPDYGTGRCDFPKGSSRDLYESVNNLYNLPDSTDVYVGHDYQPNGRELKFKTSILESKNNNIKLNKNTKKEDFIKSRDDRDKTLDAPKLLLPSIQVNINGGDFSKPEDNGVSYLKIPIKK